MNTIKVEWQTQKENKLKDTHIDNAASQKYK